MTAREQLALELPLMHPTISYARGDSTVWQHSWCGAVICIPSAQRDAPGRCPAPHCDRPDDSWWKQDLPVSVFLREDGYDGSLEWLEAHETRADRCGPVDVDTRGRL